jgi:hypothetical protein
MNTRKIGRELEDYIACLLEDIDPKSRPTIGSGSGKEISDILNKKFYVECKKRNTKSITIQPKVWNKLCSEVPVGSLKIPIYVLENVDSQKWIVMDIKDFITIITEEN